MGRSPSRHQSKPPSKKRKLCSPSPSPPPQGRSALSDTAVLPNSAGRLVVATSPTTTCQNQQGSQPRKDDHSSMATDSQHQDPDVVNPIGTPNARAGHVVEESTSTNLPLTSLPAKAVALPLPITPAQFYGAIPTWLRKRAARNLDASQFFFFQMLASIMYAQLSRREAPHYATWTLLAQEHLTDSEVFEFGRKIVISTICPQLPVASTGDEDDMDDMIGGELDSGEDSEEDEDDENDKADEDDTDRVGESTSNSHAAQEQTYSSTAQEIKSRTGSLRIPDFSQVTHVFDLSEAKEDIFSLLRRICYDMAVFLDTAKDQVPYLWSQVTLLVEIKPDDNGFLASVKHSQQLEEQAAHFFASGVEEDVIGSVLGLGNKYTYREIERANIDKEAVKPLDAREYHPLGVNVRNQPTRRRNVSTPRQKMLADKFEEGRVFLDAHSAEGRHYLDLINIRAQELFPRFWGRVADLKPL
ncbi:hypothetical protein EV715DRAFT_208760 [Schizophyllum commune]